VVIGGTSAVAPLYAGLIALINADLGHSIGYLNPILYSLGAGVFSDITAGNNVVAPAAGYSAGPGYDACTGLGRLDGAALLSALSGAPPSGPPSGPPSKGTPGGPPSGPPSKGTPSGPPSKGTHGGPADTYPGNRGDTQ
jgi:kumamolisin